MALDIAICSFSAKVTS